MRSFFRKKKTEPMIEWWWRGRLYRGTQEQLEECNQISRQNANDWYENIVAMARFEAKMLEYNRIMEEGMDK